MTRPAFILGLTGSIGMGKTTTAGFLAENGLAVWDADAAVHRLYAPGGAAVFAVARRFPGVLNDGAIDRGLLKGKLAGQPQALADLEAIVHPMVAADRACFLAETLGDIVALDVPLLFETGVNALCDATLLVTAPPELQRARVLARPGMTEDQFRLIQSRQLPDAEKRCRATHILETLDLALARVYVRALIAYIREVRDA